MNRKSIAVGVGFVLSCVGVTRAQAVADYGDAPSPPYPSMHALGGPYHLDVTREWIGQGVSSTTTLDFDSSQVDLDFDDGRNVFGVSVDANNGATFNLFATVIAFDPTISNAADGTRYLNVLVDLDDNGSWDGGAEWPVNNLVIPFTALPAGVNELTVVVGLDQSVLLNTYKDHWTRVTLSDVAVPDGSGVWGVIARGETEDFLVDEVADGDAGGPGPSLVVIWPKVATVKRGVKVKIFYYRPSGLDSGAADPGDPDAIVSFKAPWAGSKWWMRVDHLRDRTALTYTGHIEFRDVNFPDFDLPLPLPGNPGFTTSGPFWRGHTPITIRGYVFGFFLGNVPGDARHKTDFLIRVALLFDPDDEWILVSTEVDEAFEQPPESIPAVSQWGMVVCGLLLLTAIAIKFGRRLRRHEL